MRGSRIGALRASDKPYRLQRARAAARDLTAALRREHRRSREAAPARAESGQRGRVPVEPDGLDPTRENLDPLGRRVTPIAWRSERARALGFGGPLFPVAREAASPRL